MRKVLQKYTVFHSYFELHILILIAPFYKFFQEYLGDSLDTHLFYLYFHKLLLLIHDHYHPE
jgi:hypothetical protein